MSMDVRIANLTADNLEDAPEWPTHPFSCKYCVYWEFPADCVGSATKRRRELMSKKLGWLRRTLKEFGYCGKILYADGKAVGYAQYAPPGYLPNAAQYPAGPPDDDAVLISCLFIAHHELRGSGLGSQLLASIIDELRTRGAEAIETFGRKGSPENPSGPAELYLRNGFRTHRDDREFPLLRLEL